MDTERMRRVMERVYGSAGQTKAPEETDALSELLRLETESGALLRLVMRRSRACMDALGGAYRRCEARRKALAMEMFLRLGEPSPPRRTAAVPGVLSALRRLVLLCRERARLYAAPERGGLPFSPEVSARFAAECRSEEAAARRLLALSQK